MEDGQRCVCVCFLSILQEVFLFLVVCLIFGLLVFSLWSLVLVFGLLSLSLSLSLSREPESVFSLGTALVTSGESEKAKVTETERNCERPDHTSRQKACFPIPNL